jgi:hypothetical protein
MYIFGTGKIRYGAVGAVLTDANNVAAVQNVKFNSEFQEALVRGAAHLSQFPLDSVRYDDEISMSFETMVFEHPLIPYLTGAAHAVVAGYDEYTFGATSVPQPMQLVFIGEGTDKKIYEIQLPRCFGQKLNLDMGRDKHAAFPVEVKFRPDPDNFVGVKLKKQQ